MFCIYAKAIGKEILNKAHEINCSVEHIENYYDEWGIGNKNALMEYYNQNKDNPYFIMDLDYYYITNYEVTKYYTQTEQGFSFWNYDYNTIFPVCCRPSIIFRGNNKEKLESLEEIFCNNNALCKNIVVEHPILNNHTILFKLDLSKSLEPVYIEADDNGMHTLIIYFETANIPWFLPKLERSILSNNELQEPIIRYIESLFRLENNMQKHIENISADDTKNSEREKMLSIKNNRNRLLDILGVPIYMRTIKYIREIELSIHKHNMNIEQAMAKIEEKEAERRRAEQLKQERIEKEKREKLERERKARQAEEYYEYEEYEDYYVQGNYRPRGGGFLSTLIRDGIENRNLKKNIGKRGKRDLIGQAGCAKSYGGYCSECNLRMACARYW